MAKSKNTMPQVQMLPMSAVELNTGQLEGLPANPREIRDEKFQKLKQNIQECPELLEYRSLMVYPIEGGKYIIIGGNMRYRAMQELGYKEVPCIIIDKDTPADKLAQYTILDNNGFGKWDWDLLANEWSDFDLDSWGLDGVGNMFEEKTEVASKGELDTDDFEDTMEMKFKFTSEEYAFVASALQRIDANKEQAILKTLEYEKSFVSI